jgi:RimJ/RimL family protein N-acetyltransferase
MAYFRPFNKADLPILQAWFEDAELSFRLSFPTDDWFVYVATNPAVCCWIGIDDGGERAALIQVDRDEEGRGYIDIAVRPDLRGRGIGAATLAAFISGPGSTYLILEGRIAPDNIASLVCARRCGFQVLQEPDEDGFIRVVRQMTPAL